jgi:hypothetical protein
MAFAFGQGTQEFVADFALIGVDRCIFPKF